MKKIKYLLVLICFMLLPSVVSAATEVSTEEELRSAIEQGGDILLKNSVIEVTDTLVIDKDVNIDGNYVIVENNSDKPLITINSGNISFTHLSLENNGNGQKIILNGGNVTLNSVFISSSVNSSDNSQGIIVNNGTLNMNNLYMDYKSKGGKNCIVINDGEVNIKDSYMHAYDNALVINSGKVTINSSYYASSGGTYIGSNSDGIYLNGGSLSLSGGLKIDGRIYINKASNDETLTIDKNFAYTYISGTNQNFSIYINPEINNLKITDKKGWVNLNNNKVQMNFCSGSYVLEPISNETNEQVCKNINESLTYDGPIYSNELKDCTNIYINNQKYIVNENNCKKETTNTENKGLTVTVPPTYESAFIYTLAGVSIITIVGITLYALVKPKNK